MKGTAQTDELDTGDSAIKEELKQAALKGGALVFGVADASAFTAAAEGYRPTDILPRPDPLWSLVVRNHVPETGRAPTTSTWN